MVWASPANIVTKHSGQEPPKDSMLKDAWINEKSFILIDFSQTYYIYYYGTFEIILTFCFLATEGQRGVMMFVIEERNNEKGNENHMNGTIQFVICK